LPHDAGGGRHGEGVLVRGADGLECVEGEEEESKQEDGIVEEESPGHGLADGDLLLHGIELLALQAKLLVVHASGAELAVARQVDGGGNAHTAVRKSADLWNM